MRQKDIAILVAIGVIAAIISALIAGTVFSSPKSRATEVPDVQPISGAFPDVKNDSQYKTIFNDKALDPTQLIKIGTSQSQQPFNSQ